MKEQANNSVQNVIHFTKMQGAGNDYIYVDSALYPVPDPVAAARAWSDRHKGIGSDGLVLIGRSPIPEADFTMRIFNADGSEAMMCGNASRCVGKYVFERGLTHNAFPTGEGNAMGEGEALGGKGLANGHHEGCQEMQIRLLTLSGIKVLFLHINNNKVESVTVDMGEPVFENPKQYLPETGVLPTGKFVSMGNPHYVIFVNDVEGLNVAHDGSSLEYHTAFPERCNIEFAEMRPDGIRVRVWERGSGITMACGTGACATAVAACKTGRAGRHSRIIMDGGTLDIEWREADNHVYMTGPAEFVFEGEIELSE